MAMTDDVYRVLIAVILLIIGLAVFNAIFAQPELDGMAEQSGYALGEAIEAVATDLPFSDSQPSLDDTDYYAIAPIRMGEPMDIFTGWTAAFSGSEPRYEIFYEKFPDDQPLGFFTTWTESYPWSGGMASQLIFYGVMRFGLGTKIGRKILSAPVVVPVNLIRRGYRWFDVLPARYVHIERAGREALSTERTAKFLNDHPWWNTRAKNMAERAEARGGKKWAKILEFDEVADTVDERVVKIADESVHAGEVSQDFGMDYVQRMFGTTAEQAGPNGKIAFDFSQIPKDEIKYMKYAREAIPEKTMREIIGEQVTEDYVQKSLRSQFDDLFEMPPTNAYYWPRFKKWTNERVVYKVTDWVKRRRVYKAASDARKWSSEVIHSFRSQSDHMVITFRDDSGRIFQASRKQLMEMSPEKKIKIANQLGGAFEDDAKAIAHFDSLINAQKYKDTMMYIPEESILYGNQRVIDQLRTQRMTNLLELDQRYIDMDDVQKGYIRKMFEESNIFDESVYDNSMVEDIYANYWDEILRKNYQKGGIPQIQEEMYGFAFQKIANDPEQIAMLTDMFSGRYAANPWIEGTERVLGGSDPSRRLRRVIMFDFGKYKNPFWHGAFTTQMAAENQISNLGMTNKNSIIIMEGSEPMAIPLSEEVNGYEVKLYRPKPSIGEVVPIHAGTAMFYGSVVANPRYYSVSPCFGLAKVWKEPSGTGKGTIYVKMEPMCNVENEDGTDNSDSTCANYCYATNDRIWGKIAEGSETKPILGYSPFIDGVSEYVGVYATCVAASLGTGTLTCNQGAALTAGGVVAAKVAAHAATDDCKDESYWGYWNYYLAADTFDWLETIGTWGASAGAKEGAKQGEKLTLKGAAKKVGKAIKNPRTTAKAAGRYAKKNIGKLAPDASLGPQLAGDMVLAWTNIGYDKYGITYEQILSSQAECVWERP